MTKRVKFIFGIIIGVMIGLVTGWFLSILLIVPLTLFLMSDLPEPWTTIQEKIAIGVGIISWVLIILSGVVGGWLGWRRSRGEPTRLLNELKPKNLLPVIMVLVGVGTILTIGWWIWGNRSLPKVGQPPITKISGKIEINTLPKEMTERLLFSHFDFNKGKAELYLVDNNKVKLLTSKKSPNGYIQRFSAQVSLQKDKIVYRYSVKEEHDFYRIEYEKPEYKGLYYTPASPLYISNIDGSNEQVLVEVGEKEDIPRYIWSDDGKYIFYNLVDYSTQKFDEQKSQYITNVSIWKVNVKTKEKTLLYQGKATSWKVFDFYIIGFDSETKDLFVSYQGIINPPVKNYEWQIGTIKTEISSDMNIKFNYGILLGKRGYIEKNANAKPPFMMKNGKIIYMLSTSSKIGEFSYSDIDTEEIGIIDIRTKEIKIIKSKLEKEEGGLWFIPLNEELVWISEGAKYDGKNYYSVDKIIDYNGEEVAISTSQSLVSVSPKTRFRLARFSSGKTDPRGLQETGLMLYYPDSDKNIVITEHNANFIGWID